MESFRFGGGMEFLPTFEEQEEDLLWIWERSKNRKHFERDLEAEEPELFRHFKDNVLVNHPEYQP